ncbi:hypothetical protein Runsl_3948 [Runella slithyformis DSM 19594]|uniref:Uncharacterized protein n=1 Tax=Runella slithyformis (strain ATCC 29530 / DSM 19594 / LMG 11500 / NCIMB 11436 / LSU 4) TaxID=761193 RepID=A0A7U3ZN57_RUNSL|nr:hypothetical protein Runsl_3948 [Runella slithyformis DSM 19594]
MKGLETIHILIVPSGYKKQLVLYYFVLDVIQR